MELEPPEHDRRPPSRFGWGAGVIVAVGLIGVGANLIQPGSAWGIGLFAVALVGLALFLRNDSDE